MKYFQNGLDKAYGVFRWSGDIKDAPEYWHPKSDGWIASFAFLDDLGLKGPLDGVIRITEAEARDILASLGKTDGLS